MDTITTYDEAVTAIDVAVTDCMADFGEEMEISEDEIWTDLAASILIDAPEGIAREVCRTQIGFVPQSLEQIWKERLIAKQAVIRKRTQERSAKVRADREEALRQAQLAEQQALRDQRCPRCFTIPSASGACNC